MQAYADGSGQRNQPKLDGRASISSARAGTTASGFVGAQALTAGGRDLMTAIIVPHDDQASLT